MTGNNVTPSPFRLGKRSVGTRERLQISDVGSDQSFHQAGLTDLAQVVLEPRGVKARMTRVLI
jgi:hypothetical protein